MSKKTLALIIGLVVLTAALFAVALNARQPQNPQQDEVATETEEDVTSSPSLADATLSLDPNPLEAVSGVNRVQVQIDTGANEVTAVQLEVGYDPDVLSNVTITQGSFFPNGSQLLNRNDARTGRYSYAVGITPGQDAQSGTGTVATISFTPRPGATVSETTLELLPKSLVTAPGITESVLKEAMSTTITLPVRSTSPATTQTVTTAPQQ
jgi:hypothetical protein